MFKFAQCFTTQNTCFLFAGLRPLLKMKKLRIYVRIYCGHNMQKIRSNKTSTNIKKENSYIVSGKQVDNDSSYLSAKNVLSTILLNKDTEDIILKSYIADYLSTHKDVVEDFLNKNGVYNVFFRTQVAHTRNQILELGLLDHYEDMVLVKTFATFLEAEKWVLKNGKNVVDTEEDNYNRPIVLVIVYYDNVGLFGAGEEPHHLNDIYRNKLHTYAFSKSAYEMLKCELEYDGLIEDGIDYLHYIY